MPLIVRVLVFLIVEGLAKPVLSRLYNLLLKRLVNRWLNILLDLLRPRYRRLLTWLDGQSSPRLKRLLRAMRKNRM